MDAFDAVKVKHDAQRVISARHPNVHNLAPHPAFASLEVGRSTTVLEFDQFPEKVARLNGLANMAPKMVLEERFRRVQPVDA